MNMKAQAQSATRIGAGRFLDLFADIPGYGFAERILDIFEKRERIRLIVTSDNYCELRICWGLIEFTKGSKQEFLIEGGPGLCGAALRSMEKSRKTVNVISRVVAKRELNA